MLPQARAAIVGLAGPALGEEERATLLSTPPIGVIFFKRNIIDKKQVADLAASIRSMLPNALLMVDQEGGRVARLRPPDWRAHPPAGAIGRLYGGNPKAGRRAAFLTGALIGRDCAGCGFDVVCAPVLDRAAPGAEGVIGDRSFGLDPDAVAALAEAMGDGLLAAGVQPVGKHVPGHGRTSVDSHLALPELDDVTEADLLPFRRNASLPWMMTAHVRYRRLDPVQPATLSARVLGGVVRTRIGFDGVLVSDDLAMHAVAGDPGMLAAGALEAGCDLALHCSGRIDDTRAVLEAAPPPTAAARVRLARAASLASGRRQPLDPDELAAERDALLG